ncbi:MAG: hypothetical protein WKF73_12195 [Nocardioidaceae bacterium]
MHTTWSDPDVDYEQRLLDLGGACLTGEIAQAFEEWVEALGRADSCDHAGHQAAAAHPARSS